MYTSNASKSSILYATEKSVPSYASITQTKVARLLRVTTLHNSSSLLVQFPPVVVLLLFPLTGTLLFFLLPPSVPNCREPFFSCFVLLLPIRMSIHASVHRKPLCPACPCDTESTAGCAMSKIWYASIEMILTRICDCVGRYAEVDRRESLHTSNLICAIRANSFVVNVPDLTLLCSVQWYWILRSNGDGIEGSCLCSSSWTGTGRRRRWRCGHGRYCSFVVHLGLKNVQGLRGMSAQSVKLGDGTLHNFIV